MSLSPHFIFGRSHFSADYRFLNALEKKDFVSAAELVNAVLPSTRSEGLAILIHNKNFTEAEKLITYPLDPNFFKTTASNKILDELMSVMCAQETPPRSLITKFMTNYFLNLHTDHDLIALSEFFKYAPLPLVKEITDRLLTHHNFIKRNDQLINTILGEAVKQNRADVVAMLCHHSHVEISTPLPIKYAVQAGLFHLCDILITEGGAKAHHVAHELWTQNNAAEFMRFMTRYDIDPAHLQTRYTEDRLNPNKQSLCIAFEKYKQQKQFSKTSNKRAFKNLKN